MPSLNKVMLIGNLTRDPEIRYTPKGTAVAEIGLAINRTWKDDQGRKQEDCTFVDVTLWGKTAELVEQYVHKGDPLYIEGRLSLESWDDKKTGEKRHKMKVVGEQIQFLGSKRGGEHDGEDRPRRERSDQRSERRNERPAAPPKPPPDPDLDVEADEIPFSSEAHGPR